MLAAGALSSAGPDPAARRAPAVTPPTGRAPTPVRSGEDIRVVERMGVISNKPRGAGMAEPAWRNSPSLRAGDH